MAERYDQESGQFVCDFISRLPTTDTGKLFNLYDWQRSALMEFYGTQVSETGTEDLPAPINAEWLRKYWYLYLEIPKKNGKSELAAALGLYHLFADGELNAEVYICAADKENASIVYNAAVFMATSAPWTAKMVARGELKITESRKRIEYRRRIKTGNGGYKWVTIGVMQVLSAEAYSKHGYKPSCVIFDELHAQPSRELWDIMTGAAGASRRQPVWIVLTTAGDDPDRGSIGWEIHDKAVAIRDARQLRRIQEEDGDARKVLSLRHAADEDLADAEQALLERDEENWLPILYGLTAFFGDDPDDLEKIDIWDESLWKLCNPSLGKHLSMRNVRMEAMAAKKSEAAERLFRWLRLNQWITTKSVGWISLNLYDKTQWGPSKKAAREEFLHQLDGMICYGGVDLSTSRDLTALVLLFPPQSGLDTAVIWPYGIWRPEATVDEAEKRDHVPYRDWARAGFLTLCPGTVNDYDDTIECLLPSQDYPFNQAGTILDPGYYLEPLRYWAAEKIPVRYIVTESDINALVYIESVTEKEQDGTGDVYCTIALREYVDLEAQEVATLNTTRYTGNSGRKSDAAKDITYHRVVSGDTLSMLCRRTYGDGTASYYNALAKYNGISNPHLIYVGQTIKLPPKDILLGGG